MEIERKKINIGFVIIIVVLLVVIGVLVFLLLTKDNKKESSTNTTSNSAEDSNAVVVHTNLIPEKPTKEAEELMKLIPDADDSNSKENQILSKLYIGKKLKNQDVDMSTLLAVVFENIPDDDKYFYDESCADGSLKFSHNQHEYEFCYNKNSRQEDLEYAYAVSEESMKKYLEKYFGKEVQYKKVDEINLFALPSNTYYENGYYYRSPFGSGYEPYDGFEHYDVGFLKEETKDNEKAIYMYYFYTIMHCKNDDCTENYWELYKDSDKKEKLADNVDDYSSFLKATGNKAVVYKHIYKKNVDGSYYWYSIEPVK